MVQPSKLIVPADPQRMLFHGSANESCAHETLFTSADYRGDQPAQPLPPSVEPAQIRRGELGHEVEIPSDLNRMQCIGAVDDRALQSADGLGLCMWRKLKAQDNAQPITVTLMDVSHVLSPSGTDAVRNARLRAKMTID